MKKNQKKEKIRNLSLIGFYIFIGITIVFIYFNYDKLRAEEKLYSISARGYMLDKEFDPEQYEYNLVVNDTNVDITCLSNTDIKGCNVSLDLTGKKEYLHEITVYDGKKNIKYIINIKNDSKTEEKKDNPDDKDNKPIEKEKQFFIKEVKGNTFEWRNKDIKLEVNVSPEGNYSYSFDGGYTWQDNKELLIKENKKLQIVVKNKENELSDIVNIAVDRIDKILPDAVINKISIDKSKVKLQVNAYDSLSGVDSISFNGKNYSQDNEYYVTKPGTYYFNIKDKAGNVSKNINIEVTKDDFETVNQSGEKLQTKTFTVKLNANGAAIENNSVSCTTTSSSCLVVLPRIITNHIALGWSTNASSTTANYTVNQKIQLNNNMSLYAITKKTFTATFVNNGLNYLSSSSLSCNAYNQDNRCSIVLPYFNKQGYFNSFWSTSSDVSTNLVGKNWSWDYFKQAGRTYELTGNVTLYPNFNHFHYDLSNNQYKYRSIDVSEIRHIGNTLFEFEKGIPTSVINEFMKSMNAAYSKIPELFTPGKVFVMTESTYSNYSIAYGLTHWMFSSHGGDSYSTIDLKYDTSKGEISTNAALHEMAHALDSYYSFKTGAGKINATKDFDNFYNTIGSKLYVDSEGKKISKVETFAGMVTNYYWHILKVNTSSNYYALKSGATLNSTEQNQLKIFVEKYLNIAKNGYK